MPLLAVLLAAQFMVILDITVVNVALPTIQTELGIAVADLQWLITAYTLAFGGLLLLGGRAADLLGGRRVFLGGLAVFTAASLGAALADSPGALIAARVMQGIGAAALSPAALALVTKSFPEGPARRRALAAWAAVAAGGGAFGVLFGGALTEAFEWRAIFLINVPVGVVVGISALRVLPRSAPEGGRLDVGGALLAVGSLVALIYGLVEAPDAGWGSTQTIALLGAAVAGLIGFVLVESSAPRPLVDLSVFRRRTTSTALVLMIAGMGTVLSTFFFLTIYLQHVLGHSALQTGLEFLPGALLLLATAHAGGQLVNRHGAKPVLAAGMLLGAVGALMLSDLGPGDDYLTGVLPGLAVLDAGIGLAASGIFITAMAGVPDRQAGMVSGLVTTAHEVGIALVLPVLSTIAVAGLGASSLDSAAMADPAAVTEGIGDALRVAVLILLAAAAISLVALRRQDVAPSGQAAFAHH